MAKFPVIEYNIAEGHTVPRNQGIDIIYQTLRQRGNTVLAEGSFCNNLAIAAEYEPLAITYLPL